MSILDATEISPIYQAIRMFDTTQRAFSAPDEFSFEHFLPWIHQIMPSFQEQEEEKDEFAPKISTSSNFYYTRKVN